MNYEFSSVEHKRTHLGEHHAALFHIIKVNGDQEGKKKVS